MVAAGSECVSLTVVGLPQPENLTEDEDILIGEGPTLDRPLSSLEKLHIIVGYALSRRDIRWKRFQIQI